MSVRIGIIGCGAAGRNHMKCILDAGGFELVAAADVSQDALSVEREKFGVEATFSNATKMMDTVP